MPLFNQIIELLGYWDVSEYDFFIRCNYHNILAELAWKQQKIKLRDAYSNIIKADHQDGRDEAFIEYLRQKRLMEEDIPF